MSQIQTTEAAKLPGDAPTGALARVGGAKSNLALLESIDNGYRIASAYFKSGLAPSGYKSAEAVYIGMMTLRGLGLDPVTCLKHVYVINNTPSLSTQMQLGLVLESGLLLSHRLEVQRDKDGKPTGATFTAHRKGSAEPMTTSFTMAEANAAGLTGKDNWKKSPSDMLCWRAIGRNLKYQFSDVTMGMGNVEELTDAGYEVKRVENAAAQSEPQHDPLLEDAPATPEPAGAVKSDAVLDEMLEGFNP